MEKQTIIVTLKSNKANLKERFGIEQIGIFGSYAKGTQKPESDLDLVYILNEGEKMTLDKIFDMENYLRQLLNVKKIDLVNLQFMNPLVKFKMKKDVIYV
ncbi:MAG: nucleotidyltransferase domain-containing protein [Bacteroidetes bacterium]|nr:nucleotidyltransferase domain-containing protein [Bacteroidota bacterium]